MEFEEHTKLAREEKVNYAVTMVGFGNFTKVQSSSHN